MHGTGGVQSQLFLKDISVIYEGYSRDISTVGYGLHVERTGTVFQFEYLKLK